MSRWRIFLHSVAFVLGFSVVFSLLGVLLQTALSSVSYSVQKWLSYLGGGVVIIFGLYLLGLLKIGFLEKEHKIKVKKKFSFSYLTSFVFGAAFAVGWTPCVGAVLGGILTLAITQPTSAFNLLLAYSIGLGFPFLLVGLFTEKAQGLIRRMGTKLKYVNYFFGVVLIILGVFVFTQQLGRIASFSFLIDLLPGDTITFGQITIVAAFLGGLVSFLSPCVLPLMPAFLSYLAVTTTREVEE